MTQTTPSNLLLRVDIFISSPSDVAAEREIILRVIERLNRLSYIRARYVLNPLAYEREVPPASGAPPQMVVDEYMLKPEAAYLLICVLWSRMGTPFVHPSTGAHFESGTEYEFTSAYRANLAHGKPQVLLYRKTAPNPQADAGQAAKVAAFFQQFEGSDPHFKGLYKTYTTPQEFEEMVFQHVERILDEHPPTEGKRQAAAELHEEARRLDTAMPGQVAVGRPTEVWVQVCLPTSEGFRPKLPVQTQAGDEIAREDVRESSLAVAFPVDPATGQPLPTEVSVELRAPDFAVDEAVKTVMLSPQMDSGLLIFSLTPQTSRARGIVHVAVRQKSPTGALITLGEAALYTEIVATGIQLAARIAWTILTLPLAAVSLSHTRGEELPRGGAQDVDLPAVPPQAPSETQVGAPLVDKVPYSPSVPMPAPGSAPRPRPMEQPADLPRKRGGPGVLIALIALIVVIVVIVALTRLASNGGTDSSGATPTSAVTPTGES